MATRKQNKLNNPRKSISQEQRAKRAQNILFSVLAAIMILSMIVALVAR
jgi:predicted nucleic acid-binding Zn ribbon protein